MPPQVQLLWQTLDDEWAAVISHFLLGRSGAAPAPPPPPPPIASVVADAQRQRARAAVAALEKALADASTAADERAGIAARLKSAKAELAALAGSEEEGDVRRFRDALRRLGKSEDAAGRGQERGGKSAAAHWQAARMLAHRRVSPMARLFGAVEEMVDQK